MSNFYTLLTRVGAALHANAQVNQTTVPWTHMRLGDGNGTAVIPTENQTGLVRPVHTLQITDIAVHPDNPNWVIAEAVVPSDIGGWTVRETAIYGGADGNTCIAVGNYPETYKPVLTEGAGREMVMRMVVQISSVATVKLLIDPAVAIASRAWVESLVATPDKAGLMRFATVEESREQIRGDRAVTPEGLGAALDERGGLPRFTPYVWGGLADAMPRGDTQSSGQQLLDLMYPTMRADVVATQFTCAEAEWQADPYKRVTHWSLGDGKSWMRTPDKNGVQPGNVGAFYGAGSNPQGDKIGTAVADQNKSHGHSIAALKGGDPSGGESTNSSQFAMEYFGPSSDLKVLVDNSGWTVNASGSFTASSGGEEGRPRTWYGIWLIRMYGRITNAGDLNAPALNARMDLMDARLSSFNALQFEDKLSTRALNTTYTNQKPYPIQVAVAIASVTDGNFIAEIKIGGRRHALINSYAPASGSTLGCGQEFTVPPGGTYRVDMIVNCTLNSWNESERA